MLTLRGCIAFYESTWGTISKNVYQFVLSTWRQYGGTGRPENAPMGEQDAVFDRAWADDGKSHWKAQRGRCF